MFCAQCGKRNPDGAQFCFACGHALVRTGEAAPAARTMPGSRFDPGGPAPTARDGTARTHYGGFWIRVAASLLDGFVLLALSVAAAIAMGGVGLLTGRAADAAIAGYYVVSLLLWWLYYAISESSSGQATLGKRAFGLVVTDVSERRVSFARASLRVVAKWLNAFTLGIGWILAAFTSQKRGLHDYIAGTLVIQRDPKVSPVAVVALCLLGLGIPVVGIVAAIAIPGLLRARMSGNEAAAIGSLRAIVSAQMSYAAQCRGYAPTLPSLAQGNFLVSDLTTDETVTRSGYQFTVSRGPNAQAVMNESPACAAAVTEFVARAVPTQPGSTGVRFFTTDTTGTIYQATSATFEDAAPVQ